MHLSQRFGYVLYPLVLFVFLAAPRLIAQNSAGAPQATPQSSQQNENPQQDQVRLAQQAQARIRARREQRIQHTIEDTYSHKYEIYGGGGYTRFRPGSNLQHMNESAWNGGFTDYILPRLGITGDLRGYYGTAFTGINPYNIFKPSITQYTFMAGPQYRITRGEKWAISGQVLVGAAKGIFNANSAQLPGTFVGLWPSGVDFSVSAGVPIDYNLGPGLAVRLTPNYWLTTFGSTTQLKNLGFTLGLVVRFGRR
jgi:hypothetical protein